MVEIKSPEQIEKMRQAGRLTAKVLEAVTEFIRPGVTTMEVDEFCERYIVDTLKAIPGSKGQYDYPYSVNTSLNDVICHGAPSKKRLKKGDILNVDVTVISDGYFGDSSKMFCLDAPPHAQRLVNVTQECLYKGILGVKPGATLGDIGRAIQSHAEKNHCTVVREYCGHGIGRTMHQSPQVAHYYDEKEKEKLKHIDWDLVLQEGMTFTIEPMINLGKAKIKHKTIRKKIDWDYDVNWDYALTADGRLSAQWEHTILVTPTGFEVLTMREEEKAFFA